MSALKYVQLVGLKGWINFDDENNIVPTRNPNKMCYLGERILVMVLISVLIVAWQMVAS